MLCSSGERIISVTRYEVCFLTIVILTETIRDERKAPVKYLPSSCNSQYTEIIQTCAMRIALNDVIHPFVRFTTTFESHRRCCRLNNTIQHVASLHSTRHSIKGRHSDHCGCTTRHLDQRMPWVGIRQLVRLCIAHGRADRRPAQALEHPHYKKYCLFEFYARRSGGIVHYGCHYGKERGTSYVRYISEGIETAKTKER